MRRSERILIYAALAIALSLSLGWRGPGPAATAQGGGKPVPSSPATADILGVVEKLWFSDAYRPAREGAVAEANRKLEPLLSRRAEIQQAASKVADPNSPELAMLQQQYSANNQLLEQTQQEEQDRIERFNTTQLTEAYRLVVEAAQRMARDAGYTHVFATKLDPGGIKSTNIPSALQEMLGRPCVLGDPGADLTAALIKEFKLENVVVGQPSPPAPPAPDTPRPAEK